MQAVLNMFQNKGYDPSMAMGRPAMKEATKFGQRIAAARKMVGLTQLELANRVGTTQRMVTYWERESIGLKADQLSILADALGISVDSLLGRTPKPKQRGGPEGRAKRVFDKVNALPRERQKRVLDVLETVLAGEMAQRQPS
jgi:transcriptional regulator with XRE-family HTH domain